MEEMNYEFGNFDEILTNVLCGNCRWLTKCPSDYRCPKFNKMVICLANMDNDNTGYGVE